MLLVILTGKKLLERFVEKNFENHAKFSVEKVIKTKDDKLYVSTYESKDTRIKHEELWNKI